MTKHNALRVACLGAGYFSQFHIDAWQRIDGAELVGIGDANAARANQAARAAGVQPFADLKALLHQAQPEIVDIIIPPPGHLPAIEQALTAGVRAIICQKPFCTSIKEARQATAFAQAAGVPLIIHENFRFQPWYRVIKRALDDGRIGTPHQLTFRLRPGDGQGAGAYLDRQPYFQTMDRFLVHETAVHWIDTFRFLFGPPTAVYADLRRLNPAIAGEDAGYVIFAMGADRRALFDGNRHLDHAAANNRMTMGECLVEGTAGTLTLDGGGAVHWRVFGEQTPKVLLEPDHSATFGGDCVWHLQAHVIAGLRGERPLENTAPDYLPVLEIERAVYRSADRGCRIDLMGIGQ